MNNETAILAKVDCFELADDYIIIDCSNPADQNIKITIRYIDKKMKANIEDILYDKKHTFIEKVKFILQYIRKERDGRLN